MSKKHRKEHHEEHADESWLIPYADLMTLLLALFLVLYAMSAADAQKFEQMSAAFSSAFNSTGGGSNILDHDSAVPLEQSSKTPKTTDNMEIEAAKERAKDLQAQKEQEQLEQLQAQLNEYMKKNGLSDQLSTKLNHSELRITIKDSALFDSGHATLKEESEKVAETIGSMLKPYKGYQIIIRGHTDNVPIKNSRFASNWDLSSARALNFMKVVLERSQLNPKHFQAVGMGEYHPIVSNDNAEGRAQNRRVEVTIVRKYSNHTKTLTTPAN
ncbi:flagellar motor protein MotB [Paenibacillus agilis]|uniref:Flagellar motor protein MotB n=1 Tax=Paenibacillus agilis TaxID=3020863 RepID=A0A559IC90_9BACL|nr:flagellar motor protein MotB [Paenibacillus agilis]TVX85266.1 flagellar motor protein MotB [Paenibacillus agilis]